LAVKSEIMVVSRDWTLRFKLGHSGPLHLPLSCVFEAFLNPSFFSAALCSPMALLRPARLRGCCVAVEHFVAVEQANRSRMALSDGMR
jgi:hypothetical protein